MKKVLALLLALVLVLSLAACGGNSDSGKEKKDDTSSQAEKVYSIGDTAKTDTTEIVVSNVQFNNMYNKYYADEGNQYIIVDFSIKNIGKTALTNWITTNHGTTFLLYDIPYVDYNNGYEFEVYPHVGHLSLAMFSDLKPLGKAITITSPIQVPEEVKTNTSAPLLVKLRVPNSTGTEELTYKVR